MRSAIIAALAVGALAVPHQKRALITDYSIVYVTEVVTVTAGQPIPSSHYGHVTTSSTHTLAPISTKRSSSSTKKTSSSSSKAAPVSTKASSTKAVTSTKASSTKASSTKPSSTKIVTSTKASSTKASSTKASSTKASTSAAAAKPTSYQDIAVYHHNLHRTNHSAPAIKWSADLASTAASIASTCVYAHNVTANGGGYGQNIAAGVEAKNISAIITDLFYNGEVGWYNGLYGQAQPSMTNFEHWGHFSQIVWKGTGSVGCATQDCSANGLSNVGSDVPPYFTVCNYEDPGNYANEYGANIGSPLGHPTAQWNTGL